MAWEKKITCQSLLASVPYVRDPDEAVGSWLQLVPALAIVTTHRGKEHVASSLYLCFSVGNSVKINKSFTKIISDELFIICSKDIYSDDGSGNKLEKYPIIMKNYKGRHWKNKIGTSGSKYHFYFHKKMGK